MIDASSPTADNDGYHSLDWCFQANIIFFPFFFVCIPVFKCSRCKNVLPDICLGNSLTERSVICFGWLLSLAMFNQGHIHNGVSLSGVAGSYMMYNHALLLCVHLFGERLHFFLVYELYFWVSHHIKVFFVRLCALLSWAFILRVS